MSNINISVKSGRVGKDPETRTIDGGKSVSSFTLAVNDFQKGEKVTLWFNIVVWGQQSEFVAKFVKKGDPVIVHGRDSIRDYTDKDGNKRQVYEIIAQNVEKVGTGTNTPQPQQSAPEPQNVAPSPQDSDNLPF